MSNEDNTLYDEMESTSPVTVPTSSDDAVPTSDDEDDDDNTSSPPNTKWRIVRELCSQTLLFAVVLTIIVCAKATVARNIIVDGTSMLNCLHDGDIALTNKLAYSIQDPERFDVIVFYPYGKENGEYYVKRVIGLPGETVQIKGADIYINGEMLEEHYGKEPIVYAGIADRPLTLADDEFFVLGDNRTISFDSRYEDIGPIKRENIDAKVYLRLKPFKHFGIVE